MQRFGFESAAAVVLLGNLAGTYYLRGHVVDAIELLQRELAYLERARLPASRLHVKIHQQLAGLYAEDPTTEEDAIRSIAAALEHIEQADLDPTTLADEIANLRAVSRLLTDRGRIDPRLERARRMLRDLLPQHGLSVQEEGVRLQRLIIEGRDADALRTASALLERKALPPEMRVRFMAIRLEALTWLRRCGEAIEQLSELEGALGSSGHLVDIMLEGLCNSARAAFGSTVAGDCGSGELVVAFARAARAGVRRWSAPPDHVRARLASITGFAATLDDDAELARDAVRAYHRVLQGNVDSIDDLMDAATRSWLAERSRGGAPVGAEGFVAGRFLTLDHRELGLDTAVLWTHTETFADPLLALHEDVDEPVVARALRYFGFAEIAAGGGLIQVPRINTLIADMRSSCEIVLMAAEPNLAAPVPLTWARFEEHVPAYWANSAHERGGLLLLVTSKPVDAYPTCSEMLLDGWIAELPLAVYQFETGLGTRPP